MARSNAEMLTEREAQIMDVLWKRGTALADEIRTALPGEPHDSTVRTLLRILETKGYVAHEVCGKSFVYKATVERSQAQRGALRTFLDRLFKGSAQDLVLRLIEDEVLTPAQLERIQKSIPPSRPKRRNGD